MGVNMKEELYILEKGKLNIGPKEGRVPSYGGHEGRPTGRPAPSLPASTMGKAIKKIKKSFEESRNELNNMIGAMTKGE